MGTVIQFYSVFRKYLGNNLKYSVTLYISYAGQIVIEKRLDFLLCKSLVV